MPLLGFFCATRCPGNVILRTYDLALALREAGVPVIGGFHTPMEKECLEVLLRGQQPVVICPARNIERLRLPMRWRKPYDEGRLLVLSPFGSRQRRPTTELAENRNRLVSTLATNILVAYAGPGSKTAQFCGELVAQHRRAYTLQSPRKCPPGAAWGPESCSARSGRTLAAFTRRLLSSCGKGLDAGAALSPQHRWEEAVFDNAEVIKTIRG